MVSPTHTLENGQLETRSGAEALSMAGAADTGGSQNSSTEPLPTEPSELPSSSKAV